MILQNNVVMLFVGHVSLGHTQQLTTEKKIII